MMESRTRSRLQVLPMTVLAVLLMVVVFAVPGSASSFHPGQGGKGSLVANAFGPNFQSPPSPPPQQITCRWAHNEPMGGYVNTYVCTDGGYRQPLSTPALGDGQDYLDRGGNPPGYDVANPSRFSCERRAGAGPDLRPSDYTCTYRHRHDRNWHTHTFRMDEMVTMDDPSGGNPQMEYVWPPHK